MELSRPGILYQEDKPPECLALKASGADFRKVRGLWEIEMPLVKGPHKISRTQGRSSNLKEAWVRPTS